MLIVVVSISEYRGPVRSCTRNRLLQSLSRGGFNDMVDLSGLVRQLKKERDLVQRQLSGLNAALAAFSRVYRSNGTRPRRKMSAKGRARIAAAQRARWAKVNGQKVVPIAKAGQTKDVSLGASQDRSGPTRQVG